MKKRVLHYLIIFLVFLSGSALAKNMNILVVLSDNYGPNTFFNLDNIEKLGWNVTLTAVSKSVSPCPYFDGITALKVDSIISEIKDITAYDAVALMPASWRAGNVSEDLLNSEVAIALFRAANENGLVIWTTCAGPLVLAEADLIQGKKIVGSALVNSVVTQAGAEYLGDDHPPVIDGNIVTCVRDQYYHHQNIEAIATAIENLTEVPQTDKIVSSETGWNAMQAGLDETVWSKTYGGQFSESGEAVCEAPDGGYVIVGYTFSEGAGKSDATLMKTNADGEVEWSRTYGGPGWEYGYSVAPTADSGYILTGYTTSFGAGMKDIFLVKTDSQGQPEWTQTFGGSAIEVGRSVVQTQDGGYLVCGYTETFSNGEDDILMVKFDSAGNRVWFKNFGGERPETGNSILQLADGGFLIAGATGSPSKSTGNQDFYLIRTNAQGELIWENTFGNPVNPYPFDWGNSVAQTPDSGFVFVGESNVRSPLDIYLIKTDAEGEQAWYKNLGDEFYDYGNSVCVTRDGCILVCGTIKSPETRKNDLVVVKFDSTGNIIWQKIFGGTEADWGNSIIETKDGHYIITGHTNSYGAGGYDVLLIQLSSMTPKFRFEPAAGHAPLEVAFTNESYGNIKSCQWDFDNNGTIDSEGDSVKWTYTQPGLYSVRILVSNELHSVPFVVENCVEVFDGQSAIRVNGVEGYALIPASESLNITQSFTVNAWMNPHGWGEYPNSGFGRLFYKKNITLFLVGLSSNFNNNCLAVKLIHEDGTISYTYTPQNSISLDFWQHIAVTYDAPTNQINIYINGFKQELTFNDEPAGAIADNRNENLYIGNSSVDRYSFDGAIDECSVWNSALAQKQIKVIMENYLTGGEAGLLGYWNMNEGSGQIIQDLSPNHNQGDLQTIDWTQGITVTVMTESDFIPRRSKPQHYVLHANYPNPFNPHTTISFELPEIANVKLSIFDVRGRLVKSFSKNRIWQSGFHSIVWNGQDENGHNVSSGVYFFRLVTDKYQATRKMLYLK